MSDATDTLDRMHRAEAKVSILETELRALAHVAAENARLRAQLRGNTFDAPPPLDAIADVLQFAEGCAELGWVMMNKNALARVRAWLEANTPQEVHGE